MKVATLFLGLSVTMLAMPARADQMIQTESVSQPDAPIQFKCIVGYEDSAIARFYLGTDFAFRILGDKIATAVQFTLDLYDAFGTKIGTTTAQKTGDFSPGVTIAPKIGTIPLFGGTEGVWEYKAVNAWPSLDSAKCYATAIKWQDGTIWRPGETSATAPAPSANSEPVPDTSDQISESNETTCTAKWARRFSFTALRQWNATGDACARAAQDEDTRGWGTAAARDHARAFVAYTRSGALSKATSQQMLVSEKVDFVPNNSTLYNLLSSPLLAQDGARKGSALDGPLVFTSIPSPPPAISPP